MFFSDGQILRSRFELSQYLVGICADRQIEECCVLHELHRGLDHLLVRGVFGCQPLRRGGADSGYFNSIDITQHVRGVLDHNRGGLADGLHGPRRALVTGRNSRPQNAVPLA